MTMNFEIDAVVEIPLGSYFKYEVDKKTGQLTIDRPLPSPLPYNYGFVPNTLHGDGDPLDICIITDGPIYPLTKLKVTLLGAFKCIDNGESDDKLVAIVKGTEDFALLGWDRISTLEQHKRAISHYLSTYKEGFIVNEFVGPEEAYEIVMKDIESFIHE